MTTIADHRILAAYHWHAYTVVARIADQLIGGPGPVDQATYGAMVGDVVDALWTLIVVRAACELLTLRRFLRVARAAGAFHDDAATVEVASTTRPGVVYTVALDGSRCSCPGFTFHGHCKHIQPAPRRAA